ncbi:MFS transporter [Mucilaginibacter galii]|uniref:MFS transporter n=1 Tax=Mucilaginibacter galii TaxID=2005073 RepID=A0A917J9U2_9SPHI|nr:MFS transporter [Mucilaginibacter galii]GGI51448.1 MFS transporter [Mucilaginibacter galii]
MESKDNPQTIRAWAMFDWANSAYNLVITSTIFPAYYTAITTTKGNGDRVMFLGHQFVNTALSNYVLAVAYFIVVLMLPILTAIADYKGNKKSYMQLFTWLGGLACCGLYFFKLDTLELGMLCFALAAIGYCSGAVFYNSYLPQIATLDKQDSVSAKGFTYGYVGSVLLQIICFVFVMKPLWFGITDASFPPRLSFLLVGIWWLGFAQIPFFKLPKGQPNNRTQHQNVISGGFKELARVWKNIKSNPILKKYLSAFFFYSMGVQTVMLVATGFAAKELKMPTESLIAIILIIQLVAIAGAALMSKLSAVYGNVKVLIGVVMIWVFVCVAAYFTQTSTQFYLLAVVVGLVMGGIQSLSRSTYSKFLPQNIPDTASYFSFYDVTEKLAIVIGLFTFGFVESLTNSMRNSALVLTIFFIAGLLLLFMLLNTQKQQALEPVSAA